MELDLYSHSNDKSLMEMRSSSKFKAPQDVVSGQSLHSKPKRTTSRSSSVSWAEPISNTRLFDTDSPIKPIYEKPGGIATTTSNNGSSAPQDNAIVDKHCPSSKLFARPGVCAPREQKISPAATQEIALRFSVRQILRKRNPELSLTSRIENHKLTSKHADTIQTENGIGTQDFLSKEQGLFFRNGNSIEDSPQNGDNLFKTDGRKRESVVADDLELWSPPSKTTSSHLPTPPPTTGSPEPNDIHSEYDSCRQITSPEDSKFKFTPSAFRHGLPSPSPESTYLGHEDIDYKSDDENCEDELTEHDDGAYAQTAPVDDDDVPPVPPLSPINTYPSPLFSLVDDGVALPIVNSSCSPLFPPVNNASLADEVSSNLLDRDSEEEVEEEVVPSAGGIQREEQDSTSGTEEEVVPIAGGMQQKKRESVSSSTNGESRNLTPRSSTVEEGEITDYGESSSSIYSSDLNRASPEDGEVLECLSLSVLSLGDVNHHDSALFPLPSPTSPTFSTTSSEPSSSTLLPEPALRNFILAWTEKSGRGKKRTIFNGTKAPSAKRPKTVYANNNLQSSLSSGRTHVNHHTINNDKTPSPKSQLRQITEPYPKTKPSSAKATGNGARLPKKVISHSDIIKSRVLSTEQDRRRRSQLVDSYKSGVFIREVQLAEWEGRFGRILYKHEEMVVAETVDRDDVVRILDDILALRDLFIKTWKAFKAGKFQSQNSNKLIEKLERFKKAEQFGDEVRRKCEHILDAVARA
ncbi:hypothetical protein L218DRAFT_1077176 [Marasmius fiardii PR-910]|nr:hypothetical protein L218DRAFT_1077176 [Marasmius fiardii PR-910]